MKYIKTYERTYKQFDEIRSVGEKDELIGKYVICDETGVLNSVRDFLANNIGLVIGKSGSQSYQVKYKNYPDELIDFFVPHRVMRKDEIIQSSYSKKKLQQTIDQNKYNL